MGLLRPDKLGCEMTEKLEFTHSRADV